MTSGLATHASHGVSYPAPEWVAPRSSLDGTGSCTTANARRRHDRSTARPGDGCLERDRVGACAPIHAARFDVIINAEDDELAAAESSLAGSGVEVRAVRADLTTYDGVERSGPRWRGAAVSSDAVALNAGVGVNGSFTFDIPLEDDLNLIALNVTSAVHLAKRVLPDTAQAAMHAVQTKPGGGDDAEPLDGLEPPTRR